MTTVTEELPAAVAHDDGAEKAVLGIVISDQDQPGEARRLLQTPDFYKPAHQLIYEAVCRMDDARLPIEPAALVSELTRTGEIKRIPGGATYIADLYGDAPPSASLDHYARIVKDAATRRSLHLVGMKMQQMSAIDGDATPAQIVEQMRSNLDELAVARLASEVPLVGDVLNVALEEIDRLATEGAVIGVPTGFKDLDRALNGLAPGQMITIAARPGMGKALALDTPIPTPSGWSTMGELAPGGYVLDRFGNPTLIVAATEVMHDRDCYEVQFSDGSVIVADGEHQWAVRHGVEQTWAVVTTGELPFLLDACVPETHESPARYVESVTPVPSVPVRCIQVDNEERLYLAGEWGIPTHNSSLAMDIARHASFRQDKAVMVFSLEMGAAELVMRMLAAEAYVDMQSMRSGDMDEHKWQQLAKAASRMSSAKLAIDDTATVTLSEVRAKARAFQRKHGLDMIVIDYLQLMNADRRSDSRQQEVSEMSRGVKLLAKEFKVPVIILSQLNRGSEQRADKRPLVSDLRESGCLTGDTTLLRSDTGEPITFERLLRDGWEGVEVWSYDENRRIMPAQIVNVFPSGVKEVFRLTLASGRQVKASGNHQFLTDAGWIALEDLSPGTPIAVPSFIPSGPGLGWSDHRLGLLAHLLGGGCELRTAAVHYTNGDEANLSFVERAAAEFGITPRRENPGIGNWQTVSFPSPFQTARGKPNPIHAWFESMGIDNLRSWEKRIPDVVYQADLRETAVFLRHLFATDGSVWTGKDDSSAPKVFYHSTSRVLADGVATLLARFGITARIYRVNHEENHPGYNVTVASTPEILRFARDIGIHGARGDALKALSVRLAGRTHNPNVGAVPAGVWDTVRAEMAFAQVSRRELNETLGVSELTYKGGVSCGQMAQLAAVLQPDVLEALSSDDVFWDRVTCIEPLGPEQVYDATVEGNHNFIADGIIAHNSIEQDSDVVILIHREEVYEPESPKAGTAEVIIGKNRSGSTPTVVLAWLAKMATFQNLAID